MFLGTKKHLKGQGRISCYGNDFLGISFSPPHYILWLYRYYITIYGRVKSFTFTLILVKSPSLINNNIINFQKSNPTKPVHKWITLN